jgi:hypothetical protein
MLIVIHGNLRLLSSGEYLCVLSATRAIKTIDVFRI